MGLFQKLKSALGFDGAESPGTGRTGPGDVDVTVEREPSSEAEDAVKGTETTGTTAPEAGSAAEPEPTTEGDSAAEAEPASGDESVTEDGSTAGGEQVPEAEARTDEGSPTAGTESSTADGSSGDAVPDTSVTEINGIGPAYGSRLEDAGVGNVAELTDADAGELAAATDISETRIEGWIDAAREY